jgi:hypothetical protein
VSPGTQALGWPSVLGHAEWMESVRPRPRPAPAEPSRPPRSRAAHAPAPAPEATPLVVSPPMQASTPAPEPPPAVEEPAPCGQSPTPLEPEPEPEPGPELEPAPQSEPEHGPQRAALTLVPALQPAPGSMSAPAPVLLSGGVPEPELEPLGASAPVAIAKDEVMPKEMMDDLLRPPPELICPITGDIYDEPHVTEDGHLYERAAIQEWFDVKKLAGKPLLSPNTNLPLKTCRTVLCLHVGSQVTEWKENTAKRAVIFAAKYPGTAVELLTKALEYHPDNSDTWKLLSAAHQAQAADNWREECFRCLANHAQAKDVEQVYLEFIDWCEENHMLQAFERAVLRKAERRFTALRAALTSALERAGEATDTMPADSASAAIFASVECRKASQPSNELELERYPCRLRNMPKDCNYAVKKEHPCVLCVSTEGVRVLDSAAKLCSPTICQYTFHQILSWYVQHLGARRFVALIAMPCYCSENELTRAWALSQDCGKGRVFFSRDGSD